MKVSDIVNKVRLCIDEFVETITTTTTNADGTTTTTTTTTGTNDFADTSMDAVIKNSIHSALVWATRNAPVDLLAFGDSPFVKKLDLTEGSIEGITTGDAVDCWRINLPSDFVRLVRLYRAGWHKAISILAEEDSDENLMQGDSYAYATKDRPVAVLRKTKPMQIVAYDSAEAPSSDDVDVTYITTPSFRSADTDVSVSTALEPALIYYTAYLTLIAYGDDRAKSMYEAAMTLLK